MALGLVSPGIKIREVDLTVGGVGAPAETIGAIVAPFEKGPVEDPILVESEQDLIDIFGKPKLEDNQYEYWYTASNYLSYGGSLRVVRSDDDNLGNANAPIVSSGSSITNLKIKNYDDYLSNADDISVAWVWAAKHPGTWANGLKVCVIDNLADQTIGGISTGLVNTSTINFVTTATITTDVEGDLNVGVDTTGIQVSDLISGPFIPTGTTITGIGNSSITIDNAISNVGFATTSISAIIERIQVVQRPSAYVGAAVTQAINTPVAGIGTTSIADGYLKGVITGIGNSEIYVKIVSAVSAGNTEYKVAYNAFAFKTGSNISVGNTTTNSGIGTTASISVTSFNVNDWYNTQTLQLTNSEISWNTIAPKPGTSVYANSRSSSNDEIHVVIVDDTGSVTGVSGNILEKWVGLSKASDAQLSPQEKIYYKDALALRSQYIYAGSELENLVASTLNGDGGQNWNQVTQGINFNLCGNKVSTLFGGNSYNLRSAGNYITPRYDVSLSSIISGYRLFTNKREFNIDFLLMGAGFGDKYNTQAKANELIAIATLRKDCIAVISPYRSAIVDVASSKTQTDNLIDYYGALSSSSYAVFDSGYKYMFDRFNNRFVYVPLNADLAGCMCRTTINDFSWFSPAGSVRGVINNAVKLPFNPSQGERDLLYSNRINPVIYSPGSGIILFGDKTALSYQSAFDRINVRRLFMTIQANIEDAATDQLFEFNDSITRSNFVNIVEPYLRDVQAKRGITDFVVICDETNNTPDVIDNNEFRADIFVKPARSINYIGLTFVATRSGVSFEEVTGRV
jgi:hypothetical protein